MLRGGSVRPDPYGRFLWPTLPARKLRLRWKRSNGRLAIATS